MNPYSRAMRRCADFRSRTARAEFWLFYFMLYVISLLIYFVDNALGTASRNGGGLLIDLFMLLNLVPQVAIGVRRMHDTDHSGLWLLFPPVAFVFACMRGTPAANRFGAAPTAPTPRRARLVAGEPVAPASQPGEPRDAVGEIERLAKLKASGALTDGEFEVMKAKALKQEPHT